MFPETVRDFVDLARDMLREGWDGEKTRGTIEALLAEQGASLALRGEVRRATERMVGEADAEEDDDLEGHPPDEEDGDDELEGEPPAWVRGLLPVAWAGPGWVRARDLDFANELWLGVIASPWSPEPGAVPETVASLLALADAGPAGEPAFTMAQLEVAIHEARWLASQERRQRPKKRASIAPAANDSAEGAQRKRAARARVAEERRQIKAAVRAWLANVCAGCGKASDKLELNKKTGGGEALRQTPSGRRDSFGEWKAAHALGPLRCREDFDLRCRTCHIAVDRERMREGGRRSGEVRRQRRWEAVLSQVREVGHV